MNSGGGSVTGYGLAAAQLARVKNAHLGMAECRIDNIADMKEYEGIIVRPY